MASTKTRAPVRTLLAIGVAAIVATAGCSSTPKALDSAGKPLSKTDEQIFLGDTIEKNYDPHVILKRAEAFFDKEEFPEAVVELQHFLELHRAHALAPYAEFRLGEAYFRQAKSIDRDPDPINRATAIFQKLRVDYPASQYDEQAVEKIRECQEWLAKTHLFVGKFYFRRGAYLAAAHRYEVVLNDYPDMEAAPEAQYQLALAYDALGAKDWAREQLTILAQRYPKNSFEAEGAKLLAKLGGPKLPTAVAKTTPAVDDQGVRGSGTLLASVPAPPAAPEFSAQPRVGGSRLPAGASALTATPTFCRLGVWC